MIIVNGTGYAGLVAGKCLSNMGIEVVCRLDHSYIDSFRNCIPSNYEPGLNEIVKRNYTVGHLHFSTQLNEAIQGFVSSTFNVVNTPQGEADITYLKYKLAAAYQIGKTNVFRGLSFIPNTADVSEAPSIVLSNLLTEAGVHVRAYDPVAMEDAKHDLGDTIIQCKSDNEIQDADALILITEWTEFRVPNWEKVGAAMKTKVVFDGRNLYRSAIVAEAGFDYYGIGMGENIAEKA